MITKSFLPELNAVYEIQDFIKLQLTKTGFSQKKLLTFDLVIEEIITNIIQHGLKNTEKGYITIGLEIKDEKGIIEICDNGIRFNPLQEKDPDINAPLENRESGGLGIFLVKQLAEHIDYSYKDNLNILRIVLK